MSIDSQLDGGTILLSEATLENADIKSNIITLHFGEMTKELAIKIDNGLNPDTFTIPKHLTAEISIPDLPYEVKLKENHLHIGPVIGFIPGVKYYNNRKILLPRFSKYDEINGLIVIFRPKGINRTNKTIKGYYFDPGSKKFIPGTFPYPKAVYRKDFLSKTIISEFRGKLYNYPYYLDKLKFWSIMSKDEEVMKHIPETKVLEDFHKVLEMLKNHKSVYLKPHNLSCGRGIVNLTTNSEGGFLLSDTTLQLYHIKSEEELIKALKEKVHGTYLIQQEISSMWNNRRVDFRAYFHKKQDKEWHFTGIEAKVAKEGSIISNFHNREKMMLGETAMRTIFELEKEKIKTIKAELAQLSIRALTLLEKNGFRLGEAAVDLVIDKQLDIWLLEIQTDFTSESKLYRKKGERLILSKILPASFNYAKALSGFGKN
jgi:hypothetical protein